MTITLLNYYTITLVVSLVVLIKYQGYPLHWVL